MSSGSRRGGQDLDPWPGGLQQQYPIALDLAKEMLMKATGATKEGCNDQVLDAEDALQRQIV